jgi:hypothetical protein
MLSDFSRRMLGVVFGALMGLGFGLVSIYINIWALPGLPLAVTLPPQVAVILFTLAGGLMGLLTAWPEDALPGVILSSLVGVLLSSVSMLFDVRQSTTAVASTFVGLFITFLPRTFLFIPVAILIRWALSIWQNELRDEAFSLVKMLLSVGILIAAAVLSGSFYLYPKEARFGLQSTQALIQSGQQAATQAELPFALQKVDGFWQSGRGAYVLAVNNRPDQYPVQRPFAEYGVDEYAVTVRFENGYRFVCIYTPPHENPACGEY